MGGGGSLGSQAMANQRQVAQPIASSIRHIAGSALLPPAWLLSVSEALNAVMVPLEDSERCHICDAQATHEGLRIAWCGSCGIVMVMRGGVQCVGKEPRAATCRHAMEHAFRWHRIVQRFVSAQGVAHLSNRRVPGVA